MTDELHVVCREFEGFERALTRQLAALRDEVPARFTAVPMAALRARVIEGDATTAGDVDVLLCSTDWLPSLMASDRLLPLDDFIDADPPDGWPDAWVPSLRRLQTAPDGRCHGIAYHDGPMLMLYRTDRYGDDAERAGFERQYGHPLVPPATWAEYLDQARWFTRPEHGLYGTVLAGFPDEHNTVFDFMTHLWSRGGELLDEDGRSGLTSPAAREAARFVSDLWHRHRVIDPAAAGWDSVASGVHFSRGEVAMMVNWSGFAALSADPSSPTHGRVGCAPAPGGVTMNSYWVLAIPAGCRRPADAYRLIRRLASPEMDRITSEAGASAARRDTWRDPAIRRLAPYYAVLEEAHAGARALPQDPRWPHFSHIVDRLMSRLVAGDDADLGLAEAHAAVEAIR